MLNRFLFAVALSAVQLCTAQVEIQNGWFNLKDSCPDGPGDFHVLQYWEELAGNLDYFNCDFTNYIDYPYTDYHPSSANHIGFRTHGDSVQTTDVFGQVLNEPVPPDHIVELRHLVQSAYAGLWTGACARIVYYGLKDSIEVNPNAINILDYPEAIELVSSDIVDHHFFEWDTVTFASTDTITSLLITLTPLPNCKHYVHLSEVEIKSEPISDEPILPIGIIYPNPVAHDAISIAGITDTTECNFTVIATNGSTVLHGIDIDGSIDIKNLSSGMYFLRLEFKGEVFEEKFIKN